MPFVHIIIIEQSSLYRRNHTVKYCVKSIILLYAYYSGAAYEYCRRELYIRTLRARGGVLMWMYII